MKLGNRRRTRIVEVMMGLHHPRIRNKRQDKSNGREVQDLEWESFQRCGRSVREVGRNRKGCSEWRKALKVEITLKHSESVLKF